MGSSSFVGARRRISGSAANVVGDGIGFSAVEGAGADEKVLASVFVETVRLPNERNAPPKAEPREEIGLMVAPKDFKGSRGLVEGDDWVLVVGKFVSDEAAAKATRLPLLELLERCESTERSRSEPARRRPPMKLRIFSSAFVSRGMDSSFSAKEEVSEMASFSSGVSGRKTSWRASSRVLGTMTSAEESSAERSRSLPKRNLKELSSVEEMVSIDSSAVRRAAAGAVVMGWSRSDRVRLWRGAGSDFSRASLDGV